MERQYIGARYVPKFADPIEWQDGATYEPLTIVTYMGASYTSKRAVPAGVKATDSNYWVVTGNYNAQIEEYRRAVVEYMEAVGELETDVANKTGRDIVFIGDSYGANPRVANSWCSECADAMKLPPNNWHNLCVSGAAFCLEGRTHYIDELTGYNGNRKSVTDIVLLGGMNDWGSERLDIMNAAYELITYIRNNYPNAKAHVGYIGLSINSPYVSNPVKVVQAYNALGAFGYAIISNALSANHDYTRMVDESYHPNELANRYIGWSLASYLNGGDFVYNEPEVYTVQFEAAEGYTAVNAAGYSTINQASNRVELSVTRLLIKVDEPVEWANDTNRIIGKLYANNCHPGSRASLHGVHLTYQDDTGWHTTYGVIAFNDSGELILRTTGVFTPTNFLITFDWDIPLIAC